MLASGSNRHTYKHIWGISEVFKVLCEYLGTSEVWVHVHIKVLPFVHTTQGGWKSLRTYIFPYVIP